MYNDKSSFVPELASLYQDSLERWCEQLAEDNKRQAFSMEEALVGAFLQLDKDMGLEVEKAHLTSTETQEALVRIIISARICSS